MPAMPPIINVMVKAADEASRSLVRDFGEVEHLQVSQKGPSNFVSAADVRAEEIIYEYLNKARPGYGFIMEERGRIKGSEEHSDKCWHIDPLDGTHNFIHGIPHWCISIALQEGDDITAGVIYDPVRDELFWAAKGTGAWMRNRRLRVSGRTELHTSMFGSGSPAFKQGDHDLFWKEASMVMRNTMGIRRMGSAALDLAYVAAGRLDGYWEHNLHSWDVAAGYIIVKEAGGFVKSLHKGEKPFLGKSIVAANPELHKAFTDLLQKHAKAA